MSERSKSLAVEVLPPAEQFAITQTIRQASTLAGLSPWQRAQIEWKVKRQRGELILELAQVQCDLVLAEAVLTAQGRMNDAAERAALETFQVQLECMVQAGSIRDEAMSETTALTEDSGEICRGAIDRVFGRYLTGVERRAGRRS